MSEDLSMDQWATHLPALVACASETQGPVLECGVGLWSTPVLHAICAATNRPLFSYESNAAWLERFRPYEKIDASARHLVRLVPTWDVFINEHLPAADSHYGLAFVDHGHAPRGPVVAALRERADIIVMHDSECDYCGYNVALGAFDWVYTHTHSPAWTTIAGMGKPPDWMASALLPGIWGIPPTYR